MAQVGAEKKIISLKTEDGDVFVVDEAVAMEFDIVKGFYADGGASNDTVMSIPNVSGAVLTKIIKYCTNVLDLRNNKHLGTQDEVVEEQIDAFNKEFIEDESNDELQELILATNFLNVKEMLDFLNQTVADRIKNKSVEYVQKFFGIENDYTPEEEAALRSETPWAFEGLDED